MQKRKHCCEKRDYPFGTQLNQKGKKIQDKLKKDEEQGPKGNQELSVISCLSRRTTTVQGLLNIASDSIDFFTVTCQCNREEYLINQHDDDGKCGVNNIQNLPATEIIVINIVIIMKQKYVYKI